MYRTQIAADAPQIATDQVKICDEMICPNPRHLLKECAPWLTWKVAAALVAVALCAGIIAGAGGGIIAVIGATPLLAIAVCLLPCLVSLVMLRGRRDR